MVAMTNELTGKGKKAGDRLKAIGAQTDEIVLRLRAARAALDAIAREKGTERKNKQDKTIPKKRSAVEDAPARIEFRNGRLPFYIDFTFSASESEGLVNVEGCIVDCRRIHHARLPLSDTRNLLLWATSKPRMATPYGQEMTPPETLRLMWTSARWRSSAPPMQP